MNIEDAETSTLIEPHFFYLLDKERIVKIQEDKNTSKQCINVLQENIKSCTQTMN
jgi:hypothetical protein